MSLRIGDLAPDFEAETTEGRIRFHDWLGDSWAVLFSHPKDFTPVCTTELGYMAKLKPEFDKRNTKIIGLSVDPVSSHSKWAADIAETQGHAVNYPLIGIGLLYQQGYFRQFLNPDGWQTNTLWHWLHHNLDSGVLRGSQAQWDRITVPMLTVGNWTGFALHLRAVGLGLGVE